MIKEDIRFQNSCIFEGMTSIRSIITAIDNRIHNRRISKIFYSADRTSKISKEIGYLRAVSRKYQFELIESNDDALDKISLGSSHGGIIAEATDRDIPNLSESVIVKNGFYAMIQGIEDPYNFGYSLRSLYACGCSGIILPPRNWMSAAGVVCRSSAGASELFPIFKSDPIVAAEIFKGVGYNIVCADERTDNILGKCELKFPLLLIIGGERRGISRELLNMCNLRVKIEYAREFKASLSAASATTMFAYEIMRQNNR